jgi:uncharacterized protein (TIGR02147 family)
VKKLPRSKRHITGLLLGISPETYKTVCEETRKFQDRILALAEQDKSAGIAYQFNFHLFPVSNIAIDGRKK